MEKGRHARCFRAHTRPRSSPHWGRRCHRRREELHLNISPVVLAVRSSAVVQQCCGTYSILWKEGFPTETSTIVICIQLNLCISIIYILKCLPISTFSFIVSPVNPDTFHLTRKNADLKYSQTTMSRYRRKICPGNH